MAKTYNSIPTVSTGDVYTAAAHNNIAENVNNYRVPPSFSVYRTTASSAYSNGADISWEAEEYDPDGMWSSGATITINTAGIYLFTLRVYGTCAATLTLVQPSIMDAAGASIGFTANVATAPTSYGASHSSVHNLAASDTITARIYFGGGSSYTIGGGAADNYVQSRLTGMWLGQAS